MPPPKPAPIQTGYANPKLGDQYGAGEHQKIGVEQSNSLLEGKYKDIPPIRQWLKDSNAEKGVPDAMESRIQVLISLYHRAPTQFAQYYVVADLFWAIDAWLKSAKLKGAIGKSREPAMFELYKIAASKLCDFFKVSVNVLPAKLDQVFKKMEHTEPGEQVSYLSDAAREEFRLCFINGKVYRFNRTRRGYCLANTNDADLFALSSAAGDFALDAGYVLSPWDEIYMRRHDADVEKSFHSQYMSGEPVQCAGEMTIVGGVVNAINNCSGHYMPPSEHLLPLLYCLQQKGVSLVNVDLTAMGKGQAGKKYAVQCKALEYLIKGGRPTAGATFWLKRQHRDWQKLRRATGRVTYRDGRPVVGGKIKFELSGDPTLTCTGLIGHDGAFALETELNGRLVPGAVPADYRVVITPQGATAITLAGAHTIADRDDNTFSFEI